MDFPADEYDCLLAPILPRLRRCDGRAELSEYALNLASTCGARAATPTMAACRREVRRVR